MIQLIGINKIYKSGDAVTTALSGVNLSIADNDFVAIMGASGSGKSTLLNIIGCMDTPTKGQYLLDDVAVLSLNDNQLSKIRNTKITFVFQNFALMEKYSAYDNIMLPLLRRKLSKKKRTEIVLYAARQLRIEDQLHKLPKKMSGGQQQRVAIARALASGADYILADEPTGALDRKSSEEMMDIICELNESGKTVILVTHDNEIAKRAKRIIHISDGRIDKNE